MSLYISSGVFFRIAEFLSHFKSVIKRHIFPYHLCKDKVSRAVENACNFNHIIRCKALADRSYNRNTTAHTCLKKIIGIVFLCDFKQFRTLCGNEFFIGSDNTFAFQKTSLCKVVCRIDTAHYLCNNFYFFIIDYIFKILCKLICKRTVGKISYIKNIFNCNFLFRTFGNAFHVLREYFHNSRTYYTMSHYCNLYHKIKTPFYFRVEG